MKVAASLLVVNNLFSSLFIIITNNGLRNVIMFNQRKFTNMLSNILNIIRVFSAA